MLSIGRIIIASLFIIGCAPTFSYTKVPTQHVVNATVVSVYIDNSFSHDDRDSIVSVINEWNNALNGYIVLSVDNDVRKGHDYSISRLASNSPLVPNNDFINPFAWTTVSDTYIIRNSI